MKKVRGTVVQHKRVEEVQYGIDAYCDECLKERPFKEKPKNPVVNDEYDVIVPGTRRMSQQEQRRAAAGVLREGTDLSQLPGIVHDSMVTMKVIGYRCSGCDRRLDLDTKE